MNQNLSVHLRVYRGKELLRKEDGSYKNENYTVKLNYETAEYKKFIELLRTNGYVKVEVERVLDLKKADAGEKYGYAEATGKVRKDIEEEVNKAFAIPLPNQTPEQKQIAELRQMIDDLKAKGNITQEPGGQIEAPAPVATAIAPDAGLVKPEDVGQGAPSEQDESTKKPGSKK
jgi:hypothetical protein